MNLTPKFLQAWQKTYPWERGLESAATAARIHDPGGETKDGISDGADGVLDGQANFPLSGIFHVPIEELTTEQEQEIFFVYYWQKFRCEEFEDDRLAFQIYDCFVNLSPIRAGRFIQQAVNSFLSHETQIKEDGVVGSVTIATANTLEPAPLNNKLVDIRTAHYKAVRPELIQLQRRSESYRI